MGNLFYPLLATILLVASLLVACQTDENTVVAEQEVMVPSSQKLETYTGYIVYKSFEGGFYAFEGQNGEKFTLMGLAPEFRRDGLVVSIQGEQLKDVMTTSQFGTPFKLSKISVLNDIKAKDRSDL